MKFLTRLLLLSLCFVLLLGGSSGVVHAAIDEDISNVQLKIYATTSFGVTPANYVIVPFHDPQVWQTSVFSISPQKDDIFYNYIYLLNEDGSTIFEKGKKYTVTIENLLYMHYVTGMGISFRTHNCDPSVIKLYGIYNDGSVYSNGTIEKVYNNRTGHYDITLSFTPDKDIKKLYIYEEYKSTDFIDFSAFGSDNIGSLNYVYSISMGNDAGGVGVRLNVQSEEAGLLGGILGKLGDLWDKVTSIGEDIKYGFANIGTWFAELPGKLWDAIENGLKGLFVPDEQYLATYKDKWDSLLSQRLGAVYQAANYVVDIGGAIVSKPEQNTITVPSVCIDLPDNCSFEFGGWEVNLVPDGFDFLVVAIKTVVGIVCTLMFINGMIKRYDEVMGVEQ